MKLAASFWVSKTTWTAIAAIVTAVGGLASHEASVAQAVGMIFAALGTAFLRDAIARGPGGG